MVSQGTEMGHSAARGIGCGPGGYASARERKEEQVNNINEKKRAYSEEQRARREPF